MDERKKIIISIIIVILIAVVVVGATYSYWSWVTSNNEQTNVMLSVPSGSTLLKATLDGGMISVSNLAPTDCGNTTYSSKSTITLTYTNKSSTTAFINGILTVKDFTKPHGSTSGTIKPTITDLGYLRYSLRIGDTSCSDGTELASGNFADIYNNTTAVILNNGVLEKNIAPGTTNETKTLHLYVWLDKDYEYKNIGSNTVADPMEDLSFTLSWSGSIDNTPANQPIS